MALLKTLKRRMGKFSSIDPSWVQYVKDHRNFVRNNSIITLISPEESFVYRYRPESYLHSKGMDISKSWIMLWINQINSLSNFINLEYLIIPSDEYLAELKREFSNFQNSVQNQNI